ncbi:tyrosine-type recombinase/integrase [Hydrogenophaga aquatica]
MPITVKELEALRAEDKGRILTDGGSLKGQVYVAKDGTVSVQFRFAYKFAKASKSILVGTWPKMGLAEIRKARDGWRVQIRSGIDPVAERRKITDEAQAAVEAERLRIAAEREAELLKIEADRQEAILVQKQRLQQLAEKEARLSVKGLFGQWQRLELIQRADKGAEVERSFNRDVFPLIGEMAAEDVTKAHIQEIVDTIKGRATETMTMVRTAKKTLADLRQMFGFALDRDYIPADPTARIKKARLGADVERDRVLSEDEVMELFRRLPSSGLTDTAQLALMLQLGTLARIGEVLSARWEHVDLTRRLWTLPETKNGRRHDIYLSDFAVNCLKRLKEMTGLTPWLFPARRQKKDQPDFADHVCEKTVTKQVGDRQRSSGKPMSGRSKVVDGLVLPGGRWTPHDLRRTGATYMAELGVLPDVVERCLNHIEEKKVKRIYQRAQYEAPMRNAWASLGDRIQTLRSKASR